MKLNTEPSIHVDSSYQVLVRMTKQFQRRRFFRNRPIRKENCMWWPCLLTVRDEDFFKSANQKQEFIIHWVLRYDMTATLFKLSLHNSCPFGFEE
jgi:hypothetical protein